MKTPNGWQKITAIIGAFFSLFYLYESGFGIVTSEAHRGVFMLCTLALCLLLYPFRRKTQAAGPNPFDAFLAILSSIAVIYWIIQYPLMAERIGLPPRPIDIFFGLVLIIISLEVARRALGLVIPAIAIFFLFYAYFGPYFPGTLSHAGYSFERIVEYVFLSPSGIFGQIMAVYATYVMPFIIFGAFLDKSGTGDFIIDFARALTGHKTGGPALTAVVSSAGVGTISGSPIANVVTTGTFTIPLMKRIGYKPEFAAAVEASASTGGQFMPPVMGAAAFLLASFIGIPYMEVVRVSWIPAFLYFFAVGLMVYLQAAKMGLKGLPREELPRLGEVAKRAYLLLPLAVLIILFMYRFSPFYAAFWATMMTIPLGWLRRETRMTPRRIFEALVSASRDMLFVGSTAGVLGIIYSCIILTGLSTNFSGAIIEFAGGNIFIMLLITMLAGTLVGMGMTTTAAYVILSILTVPAFLNMGVPALAAHMVAFWIANYGNLTPPVCVATFAAAGIAKAEPMRAGLIGMALASYMYIMPVAFLYTPMVLWNSPSEIAWHTFIYFLAAFPLAFGLIGYMRGRISLPIRALFLISVAAIIHPDFTLDLIGILLFGLGLMLHLGLSRIRRK